MNKGEVAGKENKEGIKVENILQLRLLRLILNTYLSKKGGKVVGAAECLPPARESQVIFVPSGRDKRPFAKKQMSPREETNVPSGRDERCEPRKTNYFLCGEWRKTCSVSEFR